MAEKKKVEREFVEASTGKTGKRPAVVTAANKKSATGKRIAAVILWVLALAAEVGAILMLNGTWYIPEEQKMYWLIGALVIDLILVIIGSQLWKKANRLDPASKQSSVKFFLWNNMGLIASVICFLPIVILLLANKDLDGKTKKIVTVVAAIALVLASLFSIDLTLFPPRSWLTPSRRWAPAPSTGPVSARAITLTPIATP